MPSHVLCLDAGTTGVRALVLDGERRVRGRAYAEFTQHYPQPGHVEHDATEILETAQKVTRKALRSAKVKARDAGIGITDQRETTVLWDRQTGQPVHRAIVWQDRRTAPRCRELEGQRKAIRKTTGLVPDPYFSATKLEWLLHNVDGARRRAEAGELAFGTIDSWLAWNLTGHHVTDETNASRTMLYDIHRSRWDPAMLDLFDVPRDVLPAVVPSSQHIGDTADGAPVAALVGDQQAALFGQGCIQKGEAKNTYGTGCFLLQHTGDEAVRSRHGLLTTRAASLDGTPQYALEGSVFVGGAAVQWLRDGLKMIDASPEVNERAAEGDDSGGVVVVPAFAGLGAPHWDPDARGAVLGLSRGTSRRHIARATLESIAFQSYDVLAAMERDSGVAVPELRVDGGASQSDILMQFQADLLQRPVVRPQDVESTALGAGHLAGIALGMWGLADLDVHAEAARFEPEMTPADVERRLAAWKDAVGAVQAFKPSRGP